jgi:hypothetical protein
MKKKEVVTVEQEVEIAYCDSCGGKIGNNNEQHQNAIQISFTGTGYSTYGGKVKAEWDYVLCRKCALALKDFLDAHHSLQDLPEAQE